MERGTVTKLAEVPNPLLLTKDRRKPAPKQTFSRFCERSRGLARSVKDVFDHVKRFFEQVLHKAFAPLALFGSFLRFHLLRRRL